MGQQSGGGTPKWVIGCGVGCLVIALLGAAVVVAGWFAAKKGLDAASKELAAKVGRDYAELKAANKVPAEQTALFDEMVAVTQQENASMWAVTMVNASVTTTFADGAVSDDEAKQAQIIRDFVVANPDCSVMEMGQFFGAHPELSSLQQQAMQPGPISSGVPQSPEPVVEESGSEGP